MLTESSKKKGKNYRRQGRVGRGQDQGRGSRTLEALWLQDP